MYFFLPRRLVWTPYDLLMLYYFVFTFAKFLFPLDLPVNIYFLKFWDYVSLERYNQGNVMIELTRTLHFKYWIFLVHTTSCYNPERQDLWWKGDKCHSSKFVKYEHSDLLYISSLKLICICHQWTFKCDRQRDSKSTSGENRQKMERAKIKIQPEWPTGRQCSHLIYEKVTCVLPRYVDYSKPKKLKRQLLFSKLYFLRWFEPLCNFLLK